MNETDVSSRNSSGDEPATLVNRLRTRVDTSGMSLGDCVGDNVTRGIAIDDYPYRLVRVKHV